MRLLLLAMLMLAASAMAQAPGLPAYCGKIELKDGRVIEGACIVMERHLDAVMADYNALAARAEELADKSARCAQYRRT